jgi:hypothetical protein
MRAKSARDSSNPLMMQRSMNATAQEVSKGFERRIPTARPGLGKAEQAPDIVGAGKPIRSGGWA